MTLTNVLAGKCIDRVVTDGHRLALECGSERVRIVWVDGKPELEGVDVIIALPSVTFEALAAETR